MRPGQVQVQNIRHQRTFFSGYGERGRLAPVAIFEHSLASERSRRRLKACAQNGALQREREARRKGAKSARVRLTERRPLPSSPQSGYMHPSLDAEYSNAHSISRRYGISATLCPLSGLQEWRLLGSEIPELASGSTNIPNSAHSQMLFFKRHSSIYMATFFMATQRNPWALTLPFVFLHSFIIWALYSSCFLWQAKKLKHIWCFFRYSANLQFSLLPFLYIRFQYLESGHMSPFSNSIFL